MANPPDLRKVAVYGGFTAGAAALAYYATKKNKPIDPFFDFENQSVEIDPVEHVRVSSSLKGKPLIEYRFEDVRTLNDILPKGLELSCDGPCLGKRDAPGKGPYRWIKYSEVLDRVKWIGSGIVNKGIPSSNQTNIGIYSANRAEWIISEHACYSFSFPVVSLYDSYGKDSIKYVINHADLRAIFIDNFKRVMNVLESLDELETLQLIIHFDQFDDQQQNEIAKVLASKTRRVEIVPFEELMKLGRQNTLKPCPPKPSDVATVCYTSGTTGNPKGALLSHGNIICNEAAIIERLDRPWLGIDRLNPPVLYYSYLPLAHMLERQAAMMTFLSGGRYALISGDIATTFLDDLKELKPTDISMVPRVLNRVYNQVMNQVNQSSVKQYLLKKAIAAKEVDRKRGVFQRNTFYDRIVFNKIREILGGNIRRVATGSAPIADEVMMFSKAALSCPIPEGYGQTEGTCAITFSHPMDPVLGHVGAPIGCWMVKLVDVPEMDYYAKDNKGEICAKGPSRFLGYLKDPEKTAEVIDKDGWLHTGDIGVWLPNGTLKIIDRKKNLFKLAQGEYISPEKLENIFSRSQFVAQMFVEGNSLKDYVVGVAVPDYEYLSAYAKANLNLDTTLENLCKMKSIKALILTDLVRVGKHAGLMPYEIVKNIHLHPELFSVDNGLTTPTMKLKRQMVRNHFKQVVVDLYAETDEMLKTAPPTKKEPKSKL